VHILLIYSSDEINHVRLIARRQRVVEHPSCVYFHVTVVLEVSLLRTGCVLYIYVLCARVVFIVQISAVDLLCLDFLWIYHSYGNCLASVP
jgi:hypothetical protein